MANSWAGSFGFTYDALSRRTQMTRPNNVATNYSYDNLSHLLSVLHQPSGGTIDGAVYTLDPAGNRTAKTDEHAGVTSNYGYDAIYELLQTTQGTNTTETYTYDPVGNRLSSLGVSSYTNNSSNELTSTSSTSYAYDYNGNETSETNSAGTTNYSWDFENRLTQVTLPGTGGTVAFKYDAFGRRVQKAFTQNSTTTTTNYVYDGADAVEETDQNGNELAKYARTMNIDEPLAESRSGVTSYYQQDGLGSVTSLSNSAGALANTYTYDSFGNTTNSTGTLMNPFRYTGREFDTETNISYYRARYYNPSVGRFVSEDTTRFKGGATFYSYVWNSAPNFSDPSGLFPTWWHRDETYNLAKDVFGPKCADKAKTVADADAAVDQPWWNLLNPVGSAWQYGGPHFPVGSYGGELVNNAISTCNLNSLGVALHTLQDGFAHPLGPLGPLLHVLSGTISDWPGGVNGAAAAGATRAALQKFKDKCLHCCEGGSTTQLMSQ